MTIEEIRERLQAIAARKAEIAAEVREDPQPDPEEEPDEATEPAEQREEGAEPDAQQTLEQMDALLSELESLVAEEQQLTEQLQQLEAEEAEKAEEDEARAAEQQRREVRDLVAGGAGTVKTEQRSEKIMSNIEVRKSAEYIDAFAKYLKSGDDRECRSLLTENVSGTVPVPAIVDNIIHTAWENEEILSRVRRTTIRGNLKVAYENSATGAAVHTEGDTENPAEEELALGIVTMIPANIKKWITLSDEAVAMGGETLVTYVYEELAYQITKKLAALVIADIVAATAPAQTTITAAPGVTTVATAFANLSDQASNPVVIMNKLTYADFKSAQAAASFAYDPFEGLPVVFTSALDAYSAASSNEVYAIVGDLSGAQVNFPEGDELIVKWDDLSMAEHDLVKVVGRQYAAHAVVKPKAFTRIAKA